MFFSNIETALINFVLVEFFMKWYQKKKKITIKKLIKELHDHYLLQRQQHKIERRPLFYHSSPSKKAYRQSMM